MTGTVIVTGGSRGIGAEIVTCFVDAGWHVLSASRNPEPADEASQPLLRNFAMDVADRAAHTRVAKAALDWTGRLDCWVNGAGVSSWRNLEAIDEDFLEGMMATNLNGLVWGCQSAAAAFQPGAGSIVNISSLAGKRGSARNTVYCATKFAVNGVTQSLAKELGPRGIRVNAVCPVYVRTPGVIDALADANSPAGGEDIDTYLEDFTRTNTALGRLPTGRDVGNTCVFLAGQGAAAITGQCLNVDCGVLPQ